MPIFEVQEKRIMRVDASYDTTIVIDRDSDGLTIGFYRSRGLTQCSLVTGSIESRTGISCPNRDCVGVFKLGSFNLDQALSQLMAAKLVPDASAVPGLSVTCDLVSSQTYCWIKFSSPGTDLDVLFPASEMIINFIYTAVAHEYFSKPRACRAGHGQYAVHSSSGSYLCSVLAFNADQAVERAKSIGVHAATLALKL